MARRELKPSAPETSVTAQRHQMSAAELDRLIEEATIDCYGESEQRMGFYTMLEDKLELPFKTQVLGVNVTIERLDFTNEEEIAAVCRRGQTWQVIPILHLPPPTSPVRGAEWIEAYRRWVRGCS